MIRIKVQMWEQTDAEVVHMWEQTDAEVVQMKEQTDAEADWKSLEKIDLVSKDALVEPV